MWHLGTADTMFSEECAKEIEWDTDLKMYGWMGNMDENDDDDKDWNDDAWETECSSLEDNDTDIEYDTGLAEELDSEDSDSDDVSWCASAATMLTWEWCEEFNAKVSKRVKYQQEPVIPLM